MKILCFFLTMILTLSCNPQENEKCIDPAKINPETVCTMQYDPVCGCNGKTYGNRCEAEKEGVSSWTQGECTDERSAKL